jgi:hypothetical protein
MHSSTRDKREASRRVTTLQPTQLKRPFLRRPFDRLDRGLSGRVIAELRDATLPDAQHLEPLRVGAECGLPEPGKNVVAQGFPFDSQASTVSIGSMPGTVSPSIRDGTLATTRPWAIG